ncbi:hypothetical protein BJ165DRAFT_1493934 [Panaeolus papilionaceus]|nr:hypothetical protein BJ165DRAFT_1493934 [Panaeolus papilionaceus]
MFHQLALYSHEVKHYEKVLELGEQAGDDLLARKAALISCIFVFTGLYGRPMPRIGSCYICYHRRSFGSAYCYCFSFRCPFPVHVHYHQPPIIN